MELKICKICEKIFVEEVKCSSCGQGLTLMDENYLIGKELGKYKIEGFYWRGRDGSCLFRDT